MVADGAACVPREPKEKAPTGGAFIKKTASRADASVLFVLDSEKCLLGPRAPG
jgi:hypothetical protein